MQVDSYRPSRLLSLILGIMTLAGVALLFVEDTCPRLLPAGSHDSLAAFSLAMTAFAYVVFQMARHRAFAELVKTILLAAAFLFWAANQIWTNHPQASLFNDIAIGLFVLDVFFVIVGWPAGSSGSVLDDGYENREQPSEGAREQENREQGSESAGQRGSKSAGLRVPPK